MSLINQMLKDLDKRTASASANPVYPSQIRTVSDSSSGKRLLLIVVLLLMISGAAAAWFFWLRPAQAPAAPQPQASVTALPAPQDAPSPQPAPFAAVEKDPASKTLDSAKEQNKNDAAPRAKSAATAPSAEAAMKVAMRDAMPPIPSPEAQAEKTSTAHQSSRRNAEPTIQGKEVTTDQKAENDFGHAISLVGAGRKSEAIAALENVLAVKPKHAAARQTLTGLLLDAKRTADATRVLEEGLKLDPAQSGMAMILARLQIGNGDNKAALATLKRSQPYAANRPDYLAFMAALLQRDKRHREAAALYAQALDKSPQNAHWWMGYGISLAGDNRPTEAKQAFIHARDLHTLSPELQAFVEQEVSKL